MNTKNGAVIQLRNVSKVFSTGEMDTRALWEINLEILAGTFVAVMGPSGCGKSTLLAVMGLLETVSGGKYLLRGRDVSDLSQAARAKERNREIAYVFQAFNLIGNLTVYENVELPLVYRRVPSGERNSLIRESLERVGLSHRTNHYPAQLSGGQQQRVAVARALACRPTILLADEPTGNLDSRDGTGVMELFSALHKEGATICLVTHNAEFARYADSIVRMYDGMIEK